MQMHLHACAVAGTRFDSIAQPLIRWTAAASLTVHV